MLCLANGNYIPSNVTLGLPSCLAILLGPPNFSQICFITMIIIINLLFQTVESPFGKDTHKLKTSETSENYLYQPQK